MTADKEDSQSVGLNIRDLVALQDADFFGVDAVFSFLLRGTSQEIIKDLPCDLKIVDLSSDFILRDVNDYLELYGQPHRAPELQKEAVYGLPELYRKKIQSARLVASPGCYPTVTLLPLVPLIRANLIELEDIVITSHLGAGGAARTPIEDILYPEVPEGTGFYAFSGNLHVPEIKQELSVAANATVNVSFTPKVTSMSRGIVSMIYVRMAHGVSVYDLKQHLKEFYEKEEFVVPGDRDPFPEYVQGSNHCNIKVLGAPTRRRPSLVKGVLSQTRNGPFYKGRFWASATKSKLDDGNTRKHGPQWQAFVSLDMCSR